VKISEKALGLGRRYPITNGYRDAGHDDPVPWVDRQGVE
jgi:hypothetical protein